MDYKPMVGTYCFIFCESKYNTIVYSSYRPSYAVPQGSVLDLYINGLPEMVTNCQIILDTDDCTCCHWWIPCPDSGYIAKLYERCEYLVHVS